LSSTFSFFSFMKKNETETETETERERQTGRDPYYRDREIERDCSPFFLSLSPSSSLSLLHVLLSVNAQDTLVWKKLFRSPMLIHVLTWLKGNTSMSSHCLSRLVNAKNQVSSLSLS
jgi:hypothetical protein